MRSLISHFWNPAEIWLRSWWQMRPAGAEVGESKNEKIITFIGIVAAAVFGILPFVSVGRNGQRGLFPFCCSCILYIFHATRYRIACRLPLKTRIVLIIAAGDDFHRIIQFVRAVSMGRGRSQRIDRSS